MMRKSTQWVLAAILTICGASVFTSCTTDNSDNPVTPPEKPLPKVSKIYFTSSQKIEKNVAGTWMTIYDKANERALHVECQWTGDHMESLQTGEGLWLLTYDDHQHLTNVKSSSTRLNFAYEYDAQGRLARMVKTSPWDDNVDIIYTTTYSYTGDKLMQTECITEFTGEIDASPTAPMKKVTSYEWQGDNVVSTTIESDLLNGDHTTKQNTYEYTTLLNPFYLDILLQTGVYSVAGIEDNGPGLSKNLVKNATVEGNVYDYEYTTSGDRVTSITSDHCAEAPTMRTTSHEFYELEYVEN